MKKSLSLLTLILIFSITNLNAVTWYTHCYNYTCPEGQTMEKSNEKLVGTVEGTHQCYDKQSDSYSKVVKEINYEQCSSQPCNELKPCQAYQAGQKQAQNECLQTIYSLGQKTPDLDAPDLDSKDATDSKSNPSDDDQELFSDDSLE